VPYRRFDDRERPPRPISDVMDHWMAAQGLTELKVLATIRAQWVLMVGEEIARHSSPRSLQDGVLSVMVDHGGWVTELKFQEGRILRLIEDQVGTGVVARLNARVGAGSGLE
jgi:predicted nucleic acid-binding Zn ribbon protein